MFFTGSIRLGVGNDLKDIERYTHRQDNRVHGEASGLREPVADIGEDIKDLKTRAEEVVDHIREEVRVLEIRQKPEVYCH